MILLLQTLTSQEKQKILDQAVGAGDNYHLDKCVPTSLSLMGLSEEEGEGGQRHLKGNPDSQFPQEIRQGLDMILIGTLRVTSMNGPITTSASAFLRD
jgi:hypothetical protein